MYSTRKPLRRIACALALLLLLPGCSLIVINNPTADGYDTLPEDGDAVTILPGEEDLLPPKAGSESENRAYANAYLQSVADKGFRYDGTTVFLSAPYESIVESDEISDVCSKERYNRNRAVEDALDVRIAVSKTSANSLLDNLQASIRADEYFADLILVQQQDIGIFAASDVLFNLRSAPYLDLTQPYFNASSVAAATAGNKIYGVAGPASFEETSLTAVFFNRDLMEAFELELPYQYVYDGSWTWDVFFRYCAAVSDINGREGTTLRSFSTQYAAQNLPGNIFISCGGNFVNSNSRSTPTLALSESDSALAEVITRLYSDPHANRDVSQGVSQFHSGNSLFLMDPLYLMSWMPNSKQNWGLLPLPKFDENQKDYITCTDDTALFFAIQKNNVHAEMASVVLSAMNAASYGVLSDAYVEQAMNDLLRDNDSANMLEIISRSHTYDFALAFGPANTNLTSATFGGMSDLADGTGFSSICKRIPAADKELAGKYAAD